MADIYSSREEKELHDIFLKHNLPQQVCNDLLKVLSDVSHQSVLLRLRLNLPIFLFEFWIKSDLQPGFQGSKIKTPNVQALHDKLLEFTSDATVTRKDLSKGVF